MPQDLEIRKSVPADLAAIDALYPEVFPDEDLRPLVRELLQEEAVVLSVVAIVGGRVVGHVIFTFCDVVAECAGAALLGPLAVAPAWQRQGIGTALTQAGMQRLKDAGVSHVFVLGDPAYYGRLGFMPESDVLPPYTLPTEWQGAWQSTRLDGGARPLKGKLSVPGPWQRQALWAP